MIRQRELRQRMDKTLSTGLGGFQECTLSTAAAAQQLFTQATAQRRLRCAKRVLLHPYSSISYICLLLWTLYANTRIFTHAEVGSSMLLLIGVTMAYLVFIERITAPFLEDARKIEVRNDMTHVMDKAKGRTFIYEFAGNVIGAISATTSLVGKPYCRMDGWAVISTFRSRHMGSDLFDMLLETLPKDCAVEVPLTTLDTEALRVLNRRGFFRVKRSKRKGLVGIFVHHETWRLEELTRWAEKRDAKKQYFEGFQSHKID